MREKPQIVDGCCHLEEQERLLDAIGIPRTRIERIVCPECSAVIDGEVSWRPGQAWECYVAECSCGRLILESEWCQA